MDVVVVAVAVKIAQVATWATAAMSAALVVAAIPTAVVEVAENLLCVRRDGRVEVPLLRKVKMHAVFPLLRRFPWGNLVAPPRTSASHPLDRAGRKWLAAVPRLW